MNLFQPGDGIEGRVGLRREGYAGKEVAYCLSCSMKFMQGLKP